MKVIILYLESKKAVSQHPSLVVEPAALRIALPCSPPELPGEARLLCPSDVRVMSGTEQLSRDGSTHFKPSFSQLKWLIIKVG